MNLPNKLTLARVIAVPFFIFCYMKEFFIAGLIIFIAASFTDMLDGKIARKYNLVTNFGKIMDPLADKVLVYSAFCLMVGDNTMSAWMLIVILAREFAIAGVRTVAASEGKVIAAAMSGKIKTVLQMIAVPLLLLFNALNASSMNGSSMTLLMVLGYFAYGFLWASLIMTVVSGTEYIVKNIDVFRS
ncbi:MAG: CDP-diacylglycerol--glycerol-3-phosphate 3-phosphatidyltransferase [Eubacteriales bacterium]|nr:CDP-diacylglycerol--glycerol-3-phosphate 3-phosphatidyltransferase [Eubacteriales bacterium]